MFKWAKIKLEYKISVFLFVLAFLIYANTIKNNYSFDDAYVTVTNPLKPNNPRIEKGIKGIPEIFKTHYVEIEGQSFEYRPLVLAFFAVEYEFFGSNPHVSHLINVLLYAITCALMFLILFQLLNGYSILLSLLSTLLFLTHPIHTEVVASIKSRDELLAFLFGLISFYFVLKSLKSKYVLNVFFAMLFFFMASLCKQTYILFIALIPISLYYFKELKIKKTALIIFLLYCAIICSKILKNSLLDDETLNRTFAFFENPLFYNDLLSSKLPLAFYTLGYYAKLLFIPYPLCCYYGLNTIPAVVWNTPFVLFSMIFYATIITYILKFVLKKDYLSYSLLIFFIGVIPFSNLLTPISGIIGERLIYFASFGFSLSLSYLLLKFFKINLISTTTLKLSDFNLFFKICIGGILIIFSFLTMSRNKKWKDEITLFRNDVNHFDKSINLHYLVGNKLYPEIFKTPNGAKRDAIITEATFHYKKALNMMLKGVNDYPSDFATLNNIGIIYMNIFNDPFSAHPYFRKAVLYDSTNQMLLYNSAYCYERKKISDSAIYAYEQMLTSKNTYPQVFAQLRELYINKQEFIKAIICDKKIISVNPLIAKSYINLGNTLMMNHDTLEGIIQFEKAIELEPENLNLRNQIIIFLKSAGYSNKAIKLEDKLTR